MTLQERCYVALREMGGTASVAQVRARLGAAAGRVDHAMTRLRLKGLTVRISLGVYRMVGHGNLADGRGQSPSSQANIKKSRKYRNFDKHPHPLPRLELEKAWGWMPAFSVATNLGEED